MAQGRGSLYPATTLEANAGGGGHKQGQACYFPRSLTGQNTQTPFLLRLSSSAGDSEHGTSEPYPRQPCSSSPFPLPVLSLLAMEKYRGSRQRQNGECRGWSQGSAHLYSVTTPTAARV